MTPLGGYLHIQHLTRCYAESMSSVSERRRHEVLQDSGVIRCGPVADALNEAKNSCNAVEPGIIRRVEIHNRPKRDKQQAIFFNLRGSKQVESFEHRTDAYHNWYRHDPRRHL